MSRRPLIFCTVSLLFLISGVLIPNVAIAQDAFYSVHVGSFKKAENAAHQVAAFQARGLYSVSRSESVDGKGQWHRVYVGRFASQNEARQLAGSLMNEGAITSYTIRQVDLTATLASSVPLPYTPSAARQQVYGGTPEPPPTYQWPYPNQPQADTGAPPLPYAPRQAPPQPVMQIQAWPQAYYEQPEMSCNVPTVKQVQPPSPVEKAPLSYELLSFQPRFLIGARTGVTMWNHTGDFVVTQIKGGNIDTWNQTSATGFFLAVVPAIEFNRYFALEHRIEWATASEWGLWTLSLDPKINMPFTDNITGYLKAGLVWGDFTWDEVPGDFDDEFGWEIGSGVNYDFGRFLAGIDLTYRDIRFTYNSPGLNIWWTRGTIDLSGFSISGSFDYKF